jgi:hypothetical protein
MLSNVKDLSPLQLSMLAVELERSEWFRGFVFGTTSRRIELIYILDSRTRRIVYWLTRIKKCRISFSPEASSMAQNASRYPQSLPSFNGLFSGPCARTALQSLGLPRHRVRAPAPSDLQILIN